MIALRHAPPTKLGICAGRFELPVHDAEPEVRQILERLRPSVVESLFCSPALRCRRVAERLAQFLALPVHFDLRLHELHFGQWEGKSWSEIQTEDKGCFEHWCQHWREVSPPGGETVRELECRVREWIRDTPQGNVLVCAHAGTIRALNVVVRGQSWEMAMSQPVPYLVPVVVQ